VPQPLAPGWSPAGNADATPVTAAPVVSGGQSLVGACGPESERINVGDTVTVRLAVDV